MSLPTNATDLESEFDPYTLWSSSCKWLMRDEKAALSIRSKMYTYRKKMKKEGDSLYTQFEKIGVFTIVEDGNLYLYVAPRLDHKIRGRKRNTFKNSGILGYKD